MTCRFCGAAADPFLDFGRMPRGNGFLRPDALADEYFYPLTAAFCRACRMVQLVHQPARDRMFNDHYPFFSGSSQRMTRHFEALAQEVLGRLAGVDDPFVVEIGSNDGTLLAPLARAGVRHLGVDPSSNVAAAAGRRGVRTLCRFFDLETARRIVEEHGPADAVVAANVLCHIADLDSAAEGLRVLLRPGGWLVSEDPSVGDVLRQGSYDQFYDEHIVLFSAASLQALWARHGLELVEVSDQPTHGGSMRCWAAHHGTRPVSPSVASAFDRERALGLDRLETFQTFRRRCERSRAQLLEMLHTLRRQGRRVAGYAATSKSTTVINYCGITPELVPWICDTTPLKHGTLSPGQHIPVVPHERFEAEPPDVALLFAWNHAEEILEKERAFAARGGQWLVYVPAVALRP